MNGKVLFLQSDSLTVFSCYRDSVVVDRKWSITGDLLPVDVFAYLLSNRGELFRILFDLPEEECHLETTRPVGLRDRKHLLERIRIKCFAKALLSKVTTPNRKPNTIALVSGVYQHVLCEQLIDKIVQSGSILSSIHSTITLTGELCKRLGSDMGVRVLVIAFGNCRFRLVACVNSFVVFSRSVDCGGSESTEITYSLINSVEETVVYLNRQSIDNWQAPVICLIGDFPVGVSVEFRALVDSKTVSGIEHRESIGSIAVNMQYTGAELLLVQALRGAGSGYATPVHQKFYRKSKVRNASTALVISTLVSAGSSLVMANKLTDQHLVLSENFSQSETVANDLSDQIGIEHEYSVEAVRQALVTARLIEMRSAYSPVDFLKQVAHVVNANEKITTTSVSWQRESNLDKKSLALIMQPSGESVPLEQFYRATVSGEVGGNQGSALVAFESFVTALRQSHSDMSVVVLETPFGLGENHRTTGSEIIDAEAGFTIEVSPEGPAR